MKPITLPLTLDIAGIPVPAGSKTAIRMGERIVMVPAGLTPRLQQRRRDWHSAVELAGTQAAGPGKVRKDALSLSIVFVMPRPKHHYGTGRNRGIIKERFVSARPTGKPDTTKLLRCVEDRLTGILWYDDAQIVMQMASKQYTKQGEDSGAYVCVDSFDETVLLSNPRKKILCPTTPN